MKCPMTYDFDVAELYRYLRAQFGPLKQAQVNAINRILEGAPGVVPFTVDRKKFFDGVRSRFGSLNVGQVEGFSAILDEWDRRKLEEPRWLACMLANVWHEVGGSMQPWIESQSKRDKTRPSVETAIHRLDAAHAAGKMSWVKQVYWRKDANGQSWLGRGPIQTTHKTNYQKFKNLLGVDFIADPEKMLEMEHAVQVLFEGFIRGIWTGHKLSDYFDADTNTPRESRRIINALQAADTVLGHYNKFLAALKESVNG